MIIYDCEIIKAIPMKNVKNDPLYEYCKGWGDKKGMGISCICTYDYIEKQYAVFLEDNFSVFQELVNSAPFIAGFNNKMFDDKLCEANKISIDSNKSIDVKLMIQRAFGKLGNKRRAGFELDNLCKLNEIKSKTEDDGAFAPKLWQDGKKGRVISYCLNDVFMLKSLFDKILLKKPIIGPAGNSVTVNDPIFEMIKI